MGAPAPHSLHRLPEPVAKREGHRLIATEIEQLNERLARVEQVKKFKILPKELVPEDGDTTPTRKIKRTHAYKLFGTLVEEMYAGDNVLELDNA